MAKAKKTAKRAAKGGDAKKSAVNDGRKHGIEALAKKLGVEPATARLKLRAAKVKKDGKSYRFNDAELAKVAQQLDA